MNFLKLRNKVGGFASIRSKFILSFILLSIIPMVLLAYFSYDTYLDILRRNVQSYNEEVIDRVERNLQIYLSDLERILESRNNYYNLQFIKLSLAGDIEGNRKYTFRLWEDLNYIKNFKTDLRDVSLTTLDGVTISCYGVTHIDVSQNKIFQTLINEAAEEEKIVLWRPHQDWLRGQVFTVGRAIRGDYDNFIGVMSIDVDVKLLERICRNTSLGKTGYVMLVDEEGMIIYHPRSELIGRALSFLLGNSAFKDFAATSSVTKIGPGNQVLTVKPVTSANWKIIGISNKDELTAEMQKIANLSLTLIIGTIVALIIAAFFLSSLLTRPIKELQQTMNRASKDLNTNVVIRTQDEIGQLGKSFNQMLIRIRHLMEESVQEEKKMRWMEITALQEQIKPHFIYNTLDLIIGLLETNKNEDVINMVEALGAFFRITLSHGQEFITIREEIDHIRNFLYIQRFRHGNKYDYRIEVEEEILDKKTIKLILQPLVENAIYHGVRKLEQNGGLIVINGYSKNSRIYFEIIDNGRGMSESMVEKITLCLRGTVTVDDKKRFFGLLNVHERIILAFGREYGLMIESNLNKGTKITVEIPVIGSQP